MAATTPTQGLYFRRAIERSAMGGSRRAPRIAQRGAPFDFNHQDEARTRPRNTVAASRRVRAYGPVEYAGDYLRAKRMEV